MPRVYLTQVQRDAAKWERGDQALLVAITSRMLRRGLKQRNLAELLGISAPSVSRRLQHPETFTLEELRRLQAALSIPDEEMARCF